MKKDLHQELLTKWLRVLIYVNLVGILNSLLGRFPQVPEMLTVWASRGIMAAWIVCMLCLSDVNDRYKKAAVFRAVMLICALAGDYLMAGSLLTLAASVFSVLAVYQEYSAHAEVMEPLAPSLSRKWRSLFAWGLGIGVAAGLVSTVAVLLLAMGVPNAVRAIAILNILLFILQRFLDAVYLVYLSRMVACIR